jgi:(p)ppGpp synthase/HD superfamily hydrolase
MIDWERARDFAIEKHGSQMYGDFPYVQHLDDVAGVLERFGAKTLKGLAYLHDVLEDTNCTEVEISQNFGEYTLDIIKRVTDEPGKNRKERHEKTYPKINESITAKILKLADRIANVENCIANKSDLFKMYRKEYTGFRKALWSSVDHMTIAQKMWEHLDTLIGGKSDN